MGVEKAILFVHGFGSNANEAFSLWPQRYFLDKEFGDFDIWVFNYETGLTCSRASETVDLVSSQLAHFIFQGFVNKRNKLSYGFVNPSILCGGNALIFLIKIPYFPVKKLQSLFGVIC